MRRGCDLDLGHRYVGLIFDNVGSSTDPAVESAQQLSAHSYHAALHLQPWSPLQRHPQLQLAVRWKHHRRTPHRHPAHPYWVPAHRLQLIAFLING